MPPIRRTCLDLSPHRAPPRAGQAEDPRVTKERNHSLRSEGPKGWNQKERSSSGFNNPARPTAAKTVPNSSRSRTDRRPAKHRFRILFPAKSKNFLPCAIHKDPVKLSVDHPPAPPREAGAAPLHAHARRSQASVLHPHSQAPLCTASVFASRKSLLTR